ncbi:MAG: hypothetical protein J6I97_07370 [Agathobacter sp.]|nr:hypothetical protein [Agathobacter sp.]
MEIRCIWEHNGADSLLYAENFIGAFTRGETLEVAKDKMSAEIQSYLRWLGETTSEDIDIVISQEKASDLEIKDADSDVLFDTEQNALTLEEYTRLKELALKSAEDFHKLYQSIPDKNKSDLPIRKTFYGQVPRTAEEMYQHTKNVNSYYFAEIDVDVDNEGTIFECRQRGFELLEQKENFLEIQVIEGSYGELWSLRKMIRRFIWHDRIHAKAMWRMAKRTFPKCEIEDVFCFEEYERRN